MTFPGSLRVSIGIVLMLHLSTFANSGSGSPEISPNRVIMSLGAHPDDEDGATLAYYGRLRGVKTYSVLYTRGEGGQNEIGSQLGAELGILRAQETFDAARIIGSEVYFLGFPDFGFSKTAKESFARWKGKDEVLSRLVYYIRALKPDVIITNHDTVTTKPNRQHGNHQVVGLTAYEAFEKAADPSFHPEQLDDLITPWQVKKLFFRVYVRDSTASTAGLVEIDVSRKDSTGQAMDDISTAAIRKHRSQGMTRVVRSDSPFFRMRRYALVRSDRDYPLNRSDLFSGIKPSSRKTAQVGSRDTDPPVPLENSFRTHPTSATFSPGIMIGLVKTYDNSLEETMSAYGVPFSLIDSSHISAGDLDRFTTILLDLRTYLYRQDAARANDRLLSYCKKGGNVVCFYHKTGDWNGKNFSPLPITLTDERVTEEDAEVTVLDPTHPFFLSPNRIGPRDWKGWVQERSIYLPSDDSSKTSPNYQRLLAMSDEDEQQPATSLLWCRYGKGTYSYVSLILYRQLRVNNDGALKLFFNLISQPRGVE